MAGHGTTAQGEPSSVWNIDLKLFEDDDKNLLIPGDREPVFRLVSLRVRLDGAGLGDCLMQRLADLEAEVERRVLEQYRWPRDQLWKHRGISAGETVTNNTL